MKILLIDKNHSSMNKFKGLLARHGYRVYTAWDQGDAGGEDTEFFQGLIMVCITDGSENRLRIMQEIRAIAEFSLSPIMFCGSEQTAENLARLLFDECAPFLPTRLSAKGHRAIVSQLAGFLPRVAA